jgi:hypothetical protein
MLVVCAIGHVTDPDAFMDQHNQVVHPTDMAWDRRHTEWPDKKWYSTCRHVMQMGPVQSPHQCLRRVLGPLNTQPDLEAAYRLGGEKAVVEIFFQRHGGRK